MKTKKNIVSQRIIHNAANDAVYECLSEIDEKNRRAPSFQVG